MVSDAFSNVENLCSSPTKIGGGPAWPSRTWSGRWWTQPHQGLPGPHGHGEEGYGLPLQVHQVGHSSEGDLAVPWGFSEVLE